jgi:hypothetical protein
MQPAHDAPDVFIERLWRSLEHEDIYLKGYADGGEVGARARPARSARGLWA